MPISTPPPSWASIKNKPTTVGGFGITDMQAAINALAGFANSVAGSGYQKLPSGLVIQWGTVGFGAARYAGSWVSFPIAFNNVFSVNATARKNTTNSYTGGGSGVTSISNSSFYAVSGTYEAAAVTDGFTWVAIGN